MNYRFHKDKGIAENILEYGERIEQYEKSTGEKVQENLKVSTLIQGMRPEVKRHLLLNLDEKTKYMDLRQYLVNYESTERWTNSLAQQQGTLIGPPLISLRKEMTMEVLQRWTSTKHGAKVSGSTNVVTKEKASENLKVKAKVKVKARTLEKDLETKAKEKAKAKVEVVIGKVEVEVSEATKAEVEDSKAKAEVLVALVATKVKVKERHKQQHSLLSQVRTF